MDKTDWMIEILNNVVYAADLSNSDFSIFAKLNPSVNAYNFSLPVSKFQLKI